ncbi:hypothetical protein V5P93_000733 [Actinokineospora auranticolor]|uniref:Uncharacterized protein n=1 Tax=Actinokineospora auranticolor TaxID=155976 RepID=A0A2S6GYZ5_9PSEU|nr:hypothetical protein [Actinokineospora auranticolor]PPK70386.1 hypothetical protein CLV40_102300 [Actinokineospora auranticolor]
MATDPREPEPEKKRPNLDEIFGDVLPEITRDEQLRNPETPNPDDWYLSNRPPHHGG